MGVAWCGYNMTLPSASRLTLYMQRTTFSTEEGQMASSEWELMASHSPQRHNLPSCGSGLVCHYPLAPSWHPEKEMQSQQGLC